MVNRRPSSKIYSPKAPTLENFVPRKFTNIRYLIKNINIASYNTKRYRNIGIKIYTSI